MNNDRKRRIAGYVLVCILTMAIGFLIALQIKTTAQSGDYAGGMISLAQAQASAAELKQLKSEKESLGRQLEEIEAKVKEYESSVSDDSSILQEKHEEIAKYKMFSGMSDVEGPGVIVTIDDPESEHGVSGDSIITYNYELLLVLVNKMREADAEAISINDQRITAYTEISLAGSNVNINSVPTAPPYEVRAIGNPSTLESTLGIRYGILYSMKNDYGLTVHLYKKDSVRIPRYTGVIEFEYAKTVEEE